MTKRTWQTLALTLAAWSVIGPAFAAEKDDRLEKLYGPADCSAAVGNGSLTVSVNRYGRVTGFHWPSPGYYDQISYRTQSADLPLLGVTPSDGLMWGIRMGKETRWLVGLPWQTEQHYLGPDSNALQTVYTLPDSSVKITQTLFVHIQSNVMVSRIEVQGVDERPELFWYANFAPCTRLVPELPLADWAFDVCNDFAAFADPARGWMCHFRPESPGSVEWELARQMIEKDIRPSGWNTFEEGTWILYGCAQPPAGFQCGVEGTGSSAFSQTEAGVLEGCDAAVGSCNSAIAFRPEKQDGTYTATVFVAAGKDYAESERALSAAVERGYDNLFAETEQHWKDWLGRASIPDNPDPDVAALMKRCLLTIANATDIYSHAIVRAPVSQPPMCMDWPSDGVWVTHALDLAGFRGLAEQHNLFYAGVVRGNEEKARREPEPGKPFGSLPAALYANGVDSLPSMVLEPDAAGWTLFAFWQHSRLLDPPQQAAFLGSVWNAVNRSADFLVEWADGNTLAPLYSFDWNVLRDSSGSELTLATFVGVKSAVSIANALGEKRPDWERRMQELEAILLSSSLDADGNWREKDPLGFWLADLAPVSKRLPGAASTRLSTLPGLKGAEASRTLCMLSMIWRDDPAQTAVLATFLKPTLKHSLGLSDDAPALSAAFPDSLAASYGFLAAQTILFPREPAKPPAGTK